MGTVPVLELVDPADADLARRLVNALHHRGIPLSEDQALDIAREVSGVDRYFDTA